MTKVVSSIFYALSNVAYQMSLRGAGAEPISPGAPFTTALAVSAAAPRAAPAGHPQPSSPQAQLGLGSSDRQRQTPKWKEGFPDLSGKSLKKRRIWARTA